MSEKSNRPAETTPEKIKAVPPIAPVVQAPAAAPANPTQTPYFRDGNKPKEEKAAEVASKK